MRISVLAIIFFLPASSFAAGSTALEGTNAMGETITLYEEWTGDGFSKTIDIKVNEKRKDIFEKQPCEFKVLPNSSELSLICSRDGKSPLAGATYIVKKKWLKKCRGTLYICQSGCGPRAPRELIEHPWECGHGEGDFHLACGATEANKEGILNSNQVNLRVSPSTVAPVLHRLPKDTKVTILERQDRCLVIDDEKGQWVKVRTLSESPVSEGWVFDAYVEYLPGGK